MILIRFILIFLIVYLLVRGFMRSLLPDDRSAEGKGNQKFRDTQEKQNKKISKSIGEYVDYEETGKKD
jgi:flagellar biosynthesis/type III secretory pathway M-ring protein FliF/YscJ